MSSITGRGRYARATYPSTPRGGYVFATRPATVDVPAPDPLNFIIVTLAVPGARLGMGVLINPRETLENNLGLVHYHVLSDDVVQLVLYNLTGGPTTPGPQTFDVTLFA